MSATTPGTTETATHWYRGFKWYGEFGTDEMVPVTLWWPIADPKPSRRWWG